MSLLILLVQIALCIWIGAAVFRFLSWTSIGILAAIVWFKSEPEKKV